MKNVSIIYGSLQTVKYFGPVVSNFSEKIYFVSVGSLSVCACIPSASKESKNLVAGLG